ncbi:MAG: RNA methyltransferase [Rhodospirillales bacterium]|nr:RNA methyltransferase [Alphaproteobacteria bacterium]MCB9981811.1 RNA methyltransferase [Rhodospirillales bacterium]
MAHNGPAIILANPQMGENIGAAARAMLNFGLTDLRLVNPRDGWPNPRATDMSSGALEQMPPVGVFDTLGEAISDLQLVYATTARRRDMIKPVLTPRAAAKDAQRLLQDGQKAGFVFGAERTGLTNDEIALCSHIIQVPTNPDFSSLNLGQAVLLVAHELFQAGDDTPARALDTGDSHPAPQEDFENFFKRLECELEDGGFFTAKDLKPTMVRNIRNIFTRAELSAQEVNTLQGIVSALIGKKKSTRTK